MNSSVTNHSMRVRDVISGGLGGLKPPPIILMIQKFFNVKYTAFRRSEIASKSITTL